METEELIDNFCQKLSFQGQFTHCVENSKVSKQLLKIIEKYNLNMEDDK